MPKKSRSRRCKKHSVPTHEFRTIRAGMNATKIGERFRTSKNVVYKKLSGKTAKKVCKA